MDQAHQLRKIVAMLRENRALNKKKKSRVIAITSGKGGVGKTMFAVNFAMSLSRKGFKVLIMDADFGLANVNIVMGMPVKYDLSYVLHKEKKIDEIIVEGPEGIRFISGGHGLNELLNLTEQELQDCIDQLIQLEDIADIILIDTGAGITGNILKLIFSAGEAILVTTPEATALMDAYALTKTVTNANKNISMRLVVNMAQSVAEAESTIANFNTLTSSFLDAKLDGLGYMLYDKAVAESIRLQEPFLNCFPKSAVSRDMKKIVAKFMDQPMEEVSTGGFTGFFQRLLQKAQK